MDSKIDTIVKEEQIDCHGYARYAFRCGHCGEEHTHQEAVEVFDRNGEDSEKGRHVLVNARKEVYIDDDVEHGNPSDRRDGLKIYLTCEHCPYISILKIWQHKGNTFIDTEVRYSLLQAKRLQEMGQ
jgi:hypothetical protein